MNHQFPKHHASLPFGVLNPTGLDILKEQKYRKFILHEGKSVNYCMDLLEFDLIIYGFQQPVLAILYTMLLLEIEGHNTIYN